MSTYAIGIHADATVTADKQSAIVRKVLQVLDPLGTVTTTNAAYVAGSQSATFNTLIELGGTTETWGISILMTDSATGMYIKAYQALRRILQVLEPEIIGTTHLIVTNNLTYAAGAATTRVYPVAIVLS